MNTNKIIFYYNIKYSQKFAKNKNVNLKDYMLKLQK